MHRKHAQTSGPATTWPNWAVRDCTCACGRSNCSRTEIAGTTRAAPFGASRVSQRHNLVSIPRLFAAAANNTQRRNAAVLRGKCCLRPAAPLRPRRLGHPGQRWEFWRHAREILRYGPCLHLGVGTELANLHNAANGRRLDHPAVGAINTPRSAPAAFIVPAKSLTMAGLMLPPPLTDTATLPWPAAALKHPAPQRPRHRPASRRGAYVVCASHTITRTAVCCGWPSPAPFQVVGGRIPPHVSGVKRIAEARAIQ